MPKVAKESPAKELAWSAAPCGRSGSRLRCGPERCAKASAQRTGNATVSVTLDEFGYQELVRMIEDLRGRALTRSSKILRPDRVVQLSLLQVPLAGRYLKSAPE